MGDVVDFATYKWQKEMNDLLDHYEETMDLAALLEAIDLADKHELDVGTHILIIEDDDGQ